MTTTQKMRDDALDLLVRTEVMRDRCALYQPDRLATAEAALKDTTRAYALLSKFRLTPQDQVEVAALLVRSNLLVEAIGRPLQ